MRTKVVSFFIFSKSFQTKKIKAILVIFGRRALNFFLRQSFVAMNMMNKCAKFHKDSPSGKKVKFNLARAIELSETALFVYNFV